MVGNAASRWEELIQRAPMGDDLFDVALGAVLDLQTSEDERQRAERRADAAEQRCAHLQRLLAQEIGR